MGPWRRSGSGVGVSQEGTKQAEVFHKLLGVIKRHAHLKGSRAIAVDVAPVGLDTLGREYVAQHLVMGDA